MTGAALFRTFHTQGGCLLLDEAERLRNTQDPATAEILSMLLAGYKRGGTATRLEPVGDTDSRRYLSTCSAPRPWHASRACPRRWRAELSR